MQVIDHKLRISKISIPDNSFTIRLQIPTTLVFLMPINDSNDPNKQITLYYHFLRRICMLSPFHCLPKPEVCRLKPVTCRPAQEHSRHEPEMDCRHEPHCVVTDIPKRDSGVSILMHDVILLSDAM